MSDARTLNGFIEWLDVMDFDRKKAARALCKTERAIDYYVTGEVIPPASIRMLMTAIADGFKPEAWPE